MAVASKLQKIVSGGQAGVDRAALRTEWNVRDSDGTLIVTLAGRITGGTLLTDNLAKRLSRPLLHLCEADGSPAEQAEQAEQAEEAELLRRFIEQNEISTLNVAGPRESEEPGVGRFVAGLLEAAFGQSGAVQK